MLWRRGDVGEWCELVLEPDVLAHDLGTAKAEADDGPWRGSAAGRCANEANPLTLLVPGDEGIANDDVATPSTGRAAASARASEGGAGPGVDATAGGRSFDEP